MADQNNSTETQSELHEEAIGDEDEATETPVNVVVVTPSGHQISIQVTRLDTVQDIRQFLMDEPSTCYVTSYHLEYNRKAVNDFAELAELELTDGSKLLMVEDEYNETTARAHMRKLREIISAIPVSHRKESPSLFARIAKENPKQFRLKDDVSLADFFPESETKLKCLKKLAMSGFNPAPHHRRLQGDLFYLEIQTLEGGTLTVTSCTTGFFVNTSKQGSFSPAPLDKEKPCHSLVELLEAQSPQFKQNFHEILKTSFVTLPVAVDSLPVPFPVINWLSRPSEQTTHSYDPSRSEEYVISSAEIDFNIQGQLRDWNEELQQSRSLPRESLHDRTVRDRTIFRAHCDYIDAAVRGAVAIIDGCVPPINPMDEAKAHMFIFNNIFYSFAVDSRDIYKDVGGDQTAYKQASNDLLGVAAYNRADIIGIHTSGTAIVEYRGKRIIAQTIIPGLFSSLAQEDGQVNIAYGSLEGSEYKCDPKFHELMLKTAEKLYIKPHTVVDKSDKSTVLLAGHGDIKGILGSDHRNYILDLVRTTPRDANYPEAHHIGAILRPELLEIYIADTQQNYQKEKLEQLKAQELEKKKKAAEENPVATEEEKNKNIGPSQQYLDEVKKVMSEIVPVVPFNPDVFTPIKQRESPEVIMQDEIRVKVLAGFLKSIVIPGLVSELVNYQTVVVDSSTIVSTLHNRGINLRYLGLITSSIQKQKTSSNSLGDFPLLIVFLREMIVRVTKRIFNSYIQDTKDIHLASVISALLNSFFGKITPLGKGSRSGFGVTPSAATNSSSVKYSQRLSERISNFQLNLPHDHLWATIRKNVESKYNYTLPEVIPSALFSIATLRSLCLKIGIQLISREYDMSKEHPFKPSDVQRLYPVVKHSEPKSRDGYELLDAGKSYMLQGRVDVAFDCFSESLNLLQQIYGPVQKDVSQCHSNLARLLLATGDIKQAVAHQQTSVIINERVLGIDHYETSTSYFSLGLYASQSDSKSKIPLNFFKRSNYLNHVIGGVESPETVNTYSQLAAALQESGEKDEAQFCLNKALSLSEQFYGEKHVQTARINHQLAIVQRLAGNFKQALEHETKNYEICKELLGDNHFQTMEANLWLTHITRDAVADVAKLTGARKRPLKHTGVSTANLEPSDLQQKLLEQQHQLQQRQHELSNLSINDLLKFIENPNVKTLNRFGSSLQGSASRVGKTAAPKRTFPGGASAVARNPKSTTSTSTETSPATTTSTTISATTSSSGNSTVASTTTSTSTTSNTSENQQQKKRKKRKNKKGGPAESVNDGNGSAGHTQ